MLGESTMESIDRFWSALLSHPLDGAATARTIVQSIPDRHDREGIGTFLRESLLIVSIPKSRMTA